MLGKESGTNLVWNFMVELNRGVLFLFWNYFDGTKIVSTKKSKK
jgi:hypothetical protein